MDGLSAPTTIFAAPPIGMTDELTAIPAIPDREALAAADANSTVANCCSADARRFAQHSSRTVHSCLCKQKQLI
jgi:hypothetical protein